MKPTIRKFKDARGRIVGYRASLGPINTYDHHPTPPAAAEHAERLATEALARLDRGANVTLWNGQTIVVWPTIDGWAYWTSQFRPDYRIITGGTTREDCEDSALRHVAQALWTFEHDDRAYLDTLPERLRSDLASYFTWQREMKRLMAAGYPDEQARRIIAGYERVPA